jgi:hypothetical protein
MGMFNKKSANREGWRDYNEPFNYLASLRRNSRTFKKHQPLEEIGAMRTMKIRA